jgi:hypothetical protein
MYHVTRTATLKSFAVMPKVMGWSKEMVDYINKEYPGFDLKFGSEMFGEGRVHWMWQADSLAKLEEVNMKLMQDEKYWGFVETGKDFWLDGSLQDRMIMTMD